MQLDYFTEARLWATWLKSKFPNGAKVASITFNNDFGNSYVKGFKASIKGSNISLVGNFPHDPTAPNIDNQYTSAAATKADTPGPATLGEKLPSWPWFDFKYATALSITAR